MQRVARWLIEDHPNLIRRLFRKIDKYPLGTETAKSKLKKYLPKWVFTADEKLWIEKLELLEHRDFPGWLTFSLFLFKLELSRGGITNSLILSEIPEWIFEANSEDWGEFRDELLSDPKLAAWLKWNVDVLEKVLNG